MNFASHYGKPKKQAFLSHFNQEGRLLFDMIVTISTCNKFVEAKYIDPLNKRTKIKIFDVTNFNNKWLEQINEVNAAKSPSDIIQIVEQDFCRTNTKPNT